MIKVVRSAEQEPFFICSGIKFFIRRTEIEDDGQKFEISRGVVRASDGANVLPYFWDRGWKVALVRQARVGPNVVTLEAPGGAINWQDFKEKRDFLSKEEMVRISMARELEEEAGVKIRPEKIELVFAEYYLPSLLEGVAWGGIVEIKKSDLPSCSTYKLGQEYTEIICCRLNDLLEVKRAINPDKPSFDLWTSRLLDELDRKFSRTRKGGE